MRDRLNTLWAHVLIGVCVPLFLLLGVAGVATVVIQRFIAALHSENRTQEIITKAQAVNQEVTQLRLIVYRTGLEAEGDFNKRCLTVRARFHAAQEQLRQMIEDRPDQLARLDRLADAERRWDEQVKKNVHLLQPSPQESRDEQVRAFVARQEPLLDEMQEETRAILAEEERLLRAGRQLTLEENRHSLFLIGFTSGLALLFTLFLVVQTVRGVTRPIEKLRQAAAQMLAGKFETVPPRGPSEIIDLISHFNHMALTLMDRSAKLQAQEERYRTYVGAVSQLLWVTNACGEVTEDLPTWRTYTGFTSEMLRGMGWLKAVHPEDHHDMEAQWRKAVAERQVFEQSARLKRHDGVYRHFHCRAVPVLMRDGSVREWMGTCVDVTEQKEAAALRQAKEAAEAANRAKSDFLAKMSHELRTPLNAIIGMSKMLVIQRFGVLNSKQADYLDDITAAGEHLLELINGILDLTKVEAGKMEVNPETFAVDETVRLLVDSLQVLAESKKIALDYQSPGEGLLHTDRARFRQVLYNLVSNALKYTPLEGKIVLSGQWVKAAHRSAPVCPVDKAGGLLFTVRDNGIGIAAEEQPHIWEEFHRARGGALQSQEGTGLGLALTRRLVRLLGGDIWLESALGEGSAFHFVLPARYVAPLKEEAPDRPPRALVIEDNPENQKQWYDWLIEAGWLAATAPDCRMGLYLARQQQPRLILLNLRLAEREDWDFFDELEADSRTRGIPIVGLSASETEDEAKQRRRQRYSGLLPDPPSDKDLFRRLIEQICFPGKPI